MALYLGKKREYGKEQPWAFGKVKTRLPLAHYAIEWPEIIQGMILSVAGMGIITEIQGTMGIPFGIALTIVIINTLMYQLHPTLGDPVIPGWITPALPLTVAFLHTYDSDVTRIQAMIAIQLCIGILFILMGSTGVAAKLVEKIPASIKSGILIGAGIAALVGEFKTGGRVLAYPIGIGFSGALSFFVMYGKLGQYWRNKQALFRYIAKYGIAVPTLFGYAMSLLTGETVFPQIEWHLVRLDISGMLKTLSPFSIGFPSADIIIAAIPLAIAAYIIAFGDIIFATTLLKAADDARPDEKLVYEPNRTNLVSGLRNIIQSLVYPFIGMAGPVWTAGNAVVANRYMNSKREEMDSFWGGGASLYWGFIVAMFMGPVVSLFRPALPIAMCLMMLIQGYLSGYIGMELLKTDLERGIAIIMACVLATQGAALGLGVGIVLYLLLQHDWVKKGKGEPHAA